MIANRTDAQLKIYVEKENDVVIILLVGPVDAATFEYFKDELDPLFKEGSPKIAVDCGSLTYINSKGIGLLANYHRMLLIRKGNVVLFNVSRRLMKTLDLLGLAKRLNICASKDEAFALLAE
jgi:anti-anti-sigma factor